MSKLRIVLTFVLILLVPIVAFYLFKILSPSSVIFSMDENVIRDYVESWGIYSVFAFVAIQTFTIIFPPTPNLIPMIMGGILFGTRLGILFSFVGIMIGVTINFYLTRIFGRRIVENILNKKELGVVDKFAQEVNWRVIMLFPFLPGMYADLGGYSAGLSNMKFGKYFFSIGFGYLVLVFVANVFGKIFIRNPVLKIFLIVLLIAGAVSIFFIPLFRFLKKKF